MDGAIPDLQGMYDRCCDQRDHVPVKNLDQEMTYLSRQYGGCFIRLNTLNIDISSQLLRQWHQEGKSIHYYVPEAVVGLH